MSKVIVKLGGSVLYDSHSIQNALNRIREIEPDMIVVSAFKNQTNLLEELYRCIGDKAVFHEKKTQFFAWYVGLAESLGVPLNTINSVTSVLDDANQKLSDFEAMQKASEADVTVWGEIISSTFLAYLLQRYKIERGGVPYVFIDAREYITINSAAKDSPVLESVSFAKMNNLKKGAYITQGFIASNEWGSNCTLEREGSDYSAALFAAGYKKAGYKNVHVIFLKDVDGVYHTDPKEDKHAKLFGAMTYDDLKRIVENQKQGKVIALNAILLLKDVQISMQICSVLNTWRNGAGTRIANFTQKPISITR